jgi:hypothetical protein
MISPAITADMRKALEEQMREAHPQRPVALPSLSSLYAERLALAKRLLSREYEGLRFYEPASYLAEQFHACNAVWRLADGGNRSTKSFSASAENSRAMTGTDPYDKYDKTNGYALFVGLERKNLSQIYRSMFCEGAFKIIQDEHTGLYRTVRWDRNHPNRLQEYDEAYREKWKDAPPLIPPRMVAHISFDLPEVPRTIRLNNGWHSLWQSAAGDPELGSHYSFVRFDEEMPSTEFYTEAHRGLTRLHETIKHRPKGIWSATSQVSNVDLGELRDKALAEPESDFVRQFVFLIEDNPYFTPEARAEFLQGLREEERATRYHGIPASHVRRIYGTYNPMGDSENGSGHGCEPFEIDPRVFARYVILDPAINHCTTLFIAIDPDEQYLTVYDGFDVTGMTAREWAAKVKERQNGVKFEARVIDQQMGSCKLQGREIHTVAHEYSEALKELDVQFRRLGQMEGFIPGSNDVDARTLALQSKMEVRGSGAFAGTSELRVMRGILPELDKQIRRAQTDPKNPTKRLKNLKVPQDFLDDLEYAAAGSLSYFTPEVEEIVEEKKITAFDVFVSKQSKRREQRRREYALR